MAALQPDSGGPADPQSPWSPSWVLAAALPGLLLASELTLAVTHLKVLWRIGAPYSVSYLASQRWRYFLWDLLSVQLSWAVTYLMPLPPTPASPWAAAPEPDGASGAFVDAAVNAAGGAAVWSLLVAMVALAHALLHVYYIATWNRPHTRQVVAMSALRSVEERRRRFPLPAVLWYNLGTGFDVATHLVMAAALTPRCGVAAAAAYGNGTRLAGSGSRWRGWGS